MNNSILTITLAGLLALSTGPNLAAWTQSGNDIYYDQGRVGIGDSSPWRPLTVDGSTALDGPTDIYSGTIVWGNLSMLGNLSIDFGGINVDGSQVIDASGKWVGDPPAGAPGDPGPAPEMRTASGWIEWKHEDQGSWTQLVSLSSLEGDSGPAPEMRTASGWIEWKHEDQGSWTQLVSLSSLEGDPGSDGRDPVIGTSSTHIQWWYSNNPGSKWNLVALDDLKGEDGVSPFVLNGNDISYTDGDIELGDTPHTVTLGGTVVLAQAQGDIPMGAFQ